MKKALLAVLLLAAAAAGPLAAAPNGAGYYDTSEYLLGSIAVNIVFPESNGAGENWSQYRKDLVVDQIHQAMTWWAARESRARLSFVYPTPVTVATTYEPITCNVAAGAPCVEADWIGQVMTTLGYASGDYWKRVYAYNNAVRTANGTDWAITVFVVDSNNDADGEFADGMFAYAYLGGPFMVMTYDNGGYWIENMRAVAAHELGHLFYALDEYAESACATSQRAGYLNIQNVNCENSPITNDACIMRGGVTPYDTPAICTATRQMLAWRDSDADNLFDVADLPPGTELAAYFPDPTADNTPTYNGIARSTSAYTNSNPYDDSTNHYWYTSERNNMSLLKITGVEYNINAGAWQAAAATDGTFNQDIESFTFTTAGLADNPVAYVFRARARNTFDAYDPAPPSDDLVVNTALPTNIPYVFDGTGADISYVSSLSKLSANWGGSSHGSGISRYEYAIGTTPGGVGVRGWTSTLLVTSVTATGLALAEGATYYFSARAYSNSGFYSGASVSNGAMVDVTSPTAKVEISSPLPAKTSPLILKLIVTELNGLTGAPVLTFTPAGSSSQPVSLSSLLPSTWTGTAFIESSYSTGTAAFSFRAVDQAGNIGTLITLGGTFAIDTAVDGAAGGSVVNSDNSGVIVPAGAYTGSLVLHVSTVAASRLSRADSSAPNTAPLVANNLTREFTAVTPAGVPVTSFSAPVTIRICYPDADNDGRIDGDFISEDLARMYWLDESASRWVQMPVRPDTAGNCINAPTTHFSVYTIRTMDSSQFGMGNLKAFPNPCYFDRDARILTIRGIPPDAQKTEIYIYNVAGELVRELKRGDGVDEFNEVVWNGRQKNGAKAASGLYIYLAKTANFGDGTGKFYIFW